MDLNFFNSFNYFCTSSQWNFWNISSFSHLSLNSLIVFLCWIRAIIPFSYLSTSLFHFFTSIFSSESSPIRSWILSSPASFSSSEPKLANSWEDYVHTLLPNVSTWLFWIRSETTSSSTSFPTTSICKCTSAINSEDVGTYVTAPPA